MDGTVIPQLDGAGLRRFGLVTGVAIGVLFGLLLPWVFDFRPPLWPWLTGGGLMLWALVAPRTLNPFYLLWMRLALLLNRFTTPIVLSLVFFAVFLPVGLLMRLFGHDPMRRSLDSATTYRVLPRDDAGARNMENPF